MQALDASMTDLKELRDLEARVAGDDPDALYLLGMMYWTGRWIEGVVIPQDKRKALDMLERAAGYGCEAAAPFIAEYRKIPDADVEPFDDYFDAESTNDFTSRSDNNPLEPAQTGGTGDDTKTRSPSLAHRFENLLIFPFRLLWNIVVIVGTITLTIVWLGFVFGSVVGVILLLIFMPEGFLLPLVLFNLCVPIWPDE